jgi:phosphoribosylformylglycinamidine synthase
MSKTVKIGIITGYGINADRELVQAFKLAGDNVLNEDSLEIEISSTHINDLFASAETIRDMHIIAFPGGFSYGDHLGSGKILAHQIKNRLKDALAQFIRQKKIIIGICNGFQVLTKTGLLPNIQNEWQNEVSLIDNINGRFIDDWVKVRFNQESPCIWTKNLFEMDLPIRHGEGRFVVSDDNLLKALQDFNLTAVRYIKNLNGSVDDIAGITDPTGQILGLMPHPEAFWMPYNHPRWTRERVLENKGIKIFENGIKYAIHYLI